MLTGSGGQPKVCGSRATPPRDRDLSMTSWQDATPSRPPPQSKP